MPYAIVPMVPNASPGPRGVVGTHPLSLDFDGNAVVLSDTIALGWTPDEIPDKRVQTVCDDKLDTLSPTLRAPLQNILPDRSLKASDRFHDISGNALKTPPLGRWAPLMPHVRRRQYEVLLGPGSFLGTGPSNPGLLWSEPTEVRGPRSKSIVDTFNRANAALDGSTSSDGLFTWSLIFGPTARVNILSNQAVISRSGSEVDISLLASLSMDTAEHYVQTDIALNGTKEYGGPILRAKNGLLDATDTGYRLEIDIGFTNIYNVINNATGVALSSVATGGTTAGVLSLEFTGSTFRVVMDGVVKLSGTNTAHAGGSGERKVGWQAGAYALDTNTVTVNNFFAFDQPVTVLPDFTAFPKPILRSAPVPVEAF